MIGIALLCSSELYRADGRLHLRRAVGGARLLIVFLSSRFPIEYKGLDDL